MELPAEVRVVLHALERAGAEAYVVGGAVRDTLLGRQLRDVDVLVADRDLARARGALPDAVPIDASTPVLLVVGRELRIELTALRGDATTLEEDLRLRDFSINALAHDSSGLRDPHGGRSDLAAGILRACAPERTFRDDPLRVLRGVRLATELALQAEPDTWRAMCLDSWRLGDAPGERLRDELFRLLSNPEAVQGLELARRCGALAVVLPELLRGVGVAQNRRHSDDVYHHTLSVVQHCRAEPVLRLAALLHDVAKPETKGFLGVEGDISFHRHEHEAQPHLLRVAQRLRLSNQDAASIERLVRHHLLFEDRLQTDAAIRRMLRRVGRDILDDLLELRRADLRSRGPLPESWTECEGRIRAHADTAAAAAALELAIGGDDVKRLLGIDEGPRIGRWLARMQRHVLEHPEDNSIDALAAWLVRAAQSE